MSADGVSVVVSTGEEGLQTEDVARITDIVKQETGVGAENIRIMEAQKSTYFCKKDKKVTDTGREGGGEDSVSR